MKNIKNINKNKGFTLVELLVVIALIGVALVMVGITSGGNTGPLRRSINTADSLLARCRISSMYRPEPVTMQFTIDGGNIVGIYRESILDADGNHTTWRAEIEELGRDGNIEVFFTVDGSEQQLSRANPLMITFSRRGELFLVRFIDGDENNDIERIDGELTEIRFTNGSSTYRIAITPQTGNRRVRA